MSYLAVDGTFDISNLGYDTSEKLLAYLNTLSVEKGTVVKAGSLSYTFDGTKWVTTPGLGATVMSWAQSILGAIVGGNKSGAPTAQSSFPIVPVAIAGVVAVGAIFLLTRKGKRK